MKFATGEGLVNLKINPWKYKVYQRNEGLANTFIWAIEEDENQNIWFSTNQGISCFVRSEESIYNYDFRDNIPMASFTGRSACKDQNGVYISVRPTDFAILLPVIFWRNDKLPKPLLEK